MFALNFWLKEFLLSAFASLFEWRCEPKQLMPLLQNLPLLIKEGLITRSNYISEVKLDNFQYHILDIQGPEYFKPEIVFIESHGMPVLTIASSHFGNPSYNQLSMFSEGKLGLLRKRKETC